MKIEDLEIGKTYEFTGRGEESRWSGRICEVIGVHLDLGYVWVVDKDFEGTRELHITSYKFRETEEVDESLVRIGLEVLAKESGVKVWDGSDWHIKALIKNGWKPNKNIKNCTKKPNRGLQRVQKNGL